MRKPDRARPAGSAGELQMAPLIDTVFLLLTYFLFTISLATIEGLLPSELALGDDYREETLDLEKENQEVVIRMVQTGTRVQYFTTVMDTARYFSGPWVRLSTGEKSWKISS